ncbi:hypothetical protein [Myroides marinus]|uniref:hypothetical protein n=1 Tax=Myroides marinus TaxID=703342 RepID=UPI002575EBDD|nr:hypothetical protein [Myroides marinus]MDM1383910.1 hypothetical protein [Myroides marinus]MDM1533030.1 hypothetical protein [Myroides marinus]MDM1539993.1 hypothetical protein [Myroides marinus]
MRYIVLILFVLMSCVSWSQKSFFEYVPKNWKIVSTAKGDLNKDGIEDLVLIVKDNDASNRIKNESLGQELLDVNSRNLLILFKDKSGNYTLADSNSNGFIPSENSTENPCLSDPFTGVNIVKNILILDFNYWYSCGTYFVSNISYKFRYQNNNFELIGVEESSFSRSSGEQTDTSINFSIKKKEVTTGLNEFHESNPVTTKSSIEISELFKLKDCYFDTYSEVLSF